MFRRILIANRGEIACRVIRTARRMGVETVAVHSDIDAQALHVQQADRAVCIGTAEATASYLDADAVLNAAIETGAEAIHPGYGFLSENSAFAKACADRGIVFIGPPASAMDAMASKSAAKKLMQDSDVPVLPGYHGDEQDPEFLRQQAEQTGYPLMLKASSGGGGKGMRIVPTANEFDSMLQAVKRESLASFGDDHVLMERYLDNPRHIEIQVFSDTFGNHVHLFERDCSVQRRHQKVLEESPAPGISDQQRQRMGEAAVNAASAIAYVGAGTVEFIASKEGEFFFMEMNTRLQVEHPVTELISATDLVEWQLRVAAGEPLPKQQYELSTNGHAIEARLYAEDPANGFLPASGKLEHIQFPQQSDEQSGGAGHNVVRIDTGVRSGDTVSVYYDPMIAKVIAWGQNRESAIRTLGTALAETCVVGPVTNLQYLRYLLGQPAFAKGGVSTGFIESLEQASATPDASKLCDLWTEPQTQLAFAAIERMTALAHSKQHSAWRMNNGTGASQLWQCDDQLVRVNIKHTITDENFIIKIHSLNPASKTEDQTGTEGSQLVAQILNFKTAETAGLTDLSLDINGTRLDARLFRRAAQTIIYPQPDTSGYLHPASPVVNYVDPAVLSATESTDSGSLISPMPGKVIAVHVKPGDSVTKGQALLAVEAMKMEHVIVAPEDGNIDEVCFAEGENVADKDTLVKMSAAVADT